MLIVCGFYPYQAVLKPRALRVLAPMLASAVVMPLHIYRHAVGKRRGSGGYGLCVLHVEVRFFAGQFYFTSGPPLMARR